MPFRNVYKKNKKNRKAGLLKRRQVCQGEGAAKGAFGASVVQCSCRPVCLPFISLCCLAPEAVLTWNKKPWSSFEHNSQWAEVRETSQFESVLMYKS